MITNFLLFAILIYGCFIKFKKYIYYFQQNLYNENNRYLKWCKQNLKNIFSIDDLIVFIITILNIFSNNWITTILKIIAIILIYMDIYITNYYFSDQQKKLKKKFTLTQRIKRLCFTAIIITLILIALFIINNNLQSYLILLEYLLFTFNFFAIYLIGLINLPIEKIIYYLYWYKARNKLNKMKNLQIIGITGSYGKTSSKNIINEILNSKFLCRPSPKNYNTDTGLMITINNYLNNLDEIFIAEMGAYCPGRIKNACNLVKPNIGVLTTIGKAHLETFGSEENIIKTKFELIESLPQNGIAFLNANDPKQVNYKLKKKVKTIWYGVENNKADFNAFDIKCDYKGSNFKVYFKKEDITANFETKLLGTHNISNLIAGISIGYTLGITIDELINAVKRIQPIEHRLELKRLGNIYQIDDAYNSNPIGAQKALEVLNNMPGIKIVVTPGMVELGDDEVKENEIFGENIAKVADYVILVGEKRTKPIYNGLTKQGFKNDKIIIVNDVRLSYNIIRKLKTDTKDIYALYENDLPDIYDEGVKK